MITDCVCECECEITGELAWDHGATLHLSSPIIT